MEPTGPGPFGPTSPPRTIPVVVVFGPKRSGKDTYAQVLAQALGSRPAVGQFVAPVRTALAVLTGIDQEVLASDAKDVVVAYGRTLRDWHKWLATEAYRDVVHPHVLAHAAVRRVLDPQQWADAWVFSDARMEEEWTVLSSVLSGAAPAPWEASMPFGQQTVPPGRFQCFLHEVVRPGHGTDQPKDTHRTETSFGGLRRHPHETIVNDGTVEDLKVKALAMAVQVRQACCRHDWKEMHHTQDGGSLGELHWCPTGFAQCSLCGLTGPAQEKPKCTAWGESVLSRPVRGSTEDLPPTRLRRATHAFAVWQRERAWTRYMRGSREAKAAYVAWAELAVALQW